jgi:hypothetical protein
MLVSDFYLEVARQNAERALRRSYASDMAGDAVPVVRLLVLADVGRPLPPDAFIVASLFVLPRDSRQRPETAVAADAAGSADAQTQERQPALVEVTGETAAVSPLTARPTASTVTAASSSNAPTTDDRAEQFREVEHLFISTVAAHEYAAFAHDFPLSTRYSVRVEFFLVENEPTGRRIETSIGHAVTTLEDVLAAPRERLDTQLVSGEQSAAAGRASFGIEWMRDPSFLLAFEVRIRVDRKNSWPFSSSRPFFMLYRKEYDGQWTPLYLSEVRVKPTNHPSANGCMLYTVAEINALTSHGGDDTCTLRIEFFQYKTSQRQHNLLGYITTSVLDLRQSSLNMELGMHVNTFPRSEMVGSVRLIERQVSACRAFFSLQAEFGGEVHGSSVYVDVSMVCDRDATMRMPRGRSPFSSVKPCYHLNRANPETGTWEMVYISELAKMHRGRSLAKYQLAKLTVAKLTCGDPERPLVISLHAGTSVCVAYVRTSLSDLMSMSNGNKLRLASSTLGQAGFLELERKEVSDDRIYLGLRFVLARDAINRSDSDVDSAAVVEFDAEDLLSTPSSHDEAATAAQKF